MSVVGFDVGNDTSCVALARKRGVDVLMNKESKRETPAMVSFGEKMRFLGTDAYGKVSMNPKATPHHLKRLLGKKFSDPAVQADLSRLPFKVVEGPDGGCLVNVQYCNEQHSFTPEQLLAMVLVDLKKIAATEGGIPVTDCVLSVPAYYTESERYAMLNAAQIAGLNPLRLINETTATALAYGIYKTDLPETDPINLVFVDMGHSSTQVSVVSFKKSGLQVKSHAWDRNLGGRDIDEAMFEHFAKEVLQKQKLDIKQYPKACFKLRTGVEKVKKVLSANAESPLNIECIHEDHDVRSHLNRDELDELIEPLMQRVKLVLDKAMAESGLQPSEISTVEIIGASTRVPAVMKLVETAFGQAPSRTLNAKEVVSRGCALACAMLSPVFKVREYEVIDACPYAINFTWDKDGAPFTQTVFERHSPFPAKKAITFMRSEPFTVTASYAPSEDLPASAPATLGTYTIGPFQVPEGLEKAKLKLHFNMNLNGLVTLTQATSITEIEEVVEVTQVPAPGAAAVAEPTPNGEAAGAAPPADGAVPMAEDGAAAGPAPMEAEPPSEGPPPPPAEAAEPIKKKKVIKKDVPVAATAVGGYSQQQLNDYFETEGRMQSADKLQEDTNEAKNALEAYIYSLRGKLYEGLAPYVKEADREALSSKLSAMEDWLYEDGEDETKSTYIAKLKELQAVGEPIEQRAADDAGRPQAINELRTLASQYQQVATSELPAHAHLGGEDRGTLLKESEAALSWLNEKISLQSQLHKYDEPMLTVADIRKKKDVLDRVCQPIASKQAPPPPKPAATAPPPAAEAAAAATADGSQAAADAAAVAGDDAEPMEAEGEEKAAGEAGGEAPMEQ